MSKRNAIPVALLALAGIVAAPVTAGAAVSDAAIIALNSIEIERLVNVDGDVVVNVIDGAPNHGLSGADAQVDKDSTIDGDLYAATVQLGTGVSISGTVFQGANYAPPILEPLPPFRVAVPGDGSGGNCQPQGDCIVAVGTQVLPSGAYRDVFIAPGATLALSGGGYDVASVQPLPGKGSRTIRFDGVTQLRVAGRFDLESDAVIAAGPNLFGRDLIVYVAGENVDPASPTSRPAAASLGKNSTAAANFYVPNGTFELERLSELTGSVIAFDAAIDRQSTVLLDSAFNLAPLADAQTVFTNGVDPIDIVLTGSDPDGDALTFSITGGPSAGTLSGITQLTPTSAQVTYDANVEGAPDQFVFQVDDGKGGTDQALVAINPSDDPPDPPVLEGILAKDEETEVVQGAVNVPLTLVAAAPIAPQPNPVGDLTFAISLAPDQGGQVTTPVSVPGTPVRSATVQYTPDGGFTGTETFQFEACEAAVPSNCDQATYTIFVLPDTPPDPPVAAPQSVSTPQATEIEINLAIPAGQSGPSNETGRNSLCGNGELDQGEECDDGNLLDGDGCDSQCNLETP